MKVFAELTLRGNSLDSLIAALKTYCDAVEGWRTDEKKNQDYSVMHGSASFWVIPPKDILRVPVAIALAG